MSKKIVRFIKPTHLEYLPYKTIIQVDNPDTEDCIYYIQSSKDKNSPKWITLGTLLESVLANSIDNQELIDKCLEVYNEDSDKGCVILTFK